MDAGFLEGVRVLDLTQLLAGPVCTQLLGDMGADVIKIEPPGGERLRRSRGQTKGPTSYFFLARNRNKRSIVIDLSKEEGRTVLYRLAETADVFIQNYSQRTVEKLGLSYERLQVVNPKIVYAQVLSYGAKGVFKDFPGQDLQIQAFSGMVSLNGYPDESRPSPPSGANVSDWAAAAVIAFGVMVALYDRLRTGKGRKVETSMLAASMFVQENQLVTYLATRENPPKGGNRPVGGGQVSPPPAGIWKAGDGRELAISGGGGSDDIWSGFCAIIGKPELAIDPRFADQEARAHNHEDLFVHIQEALATKHRDEWVHEFRDHLPKLWVTEVNNYEDLCASPVVRDNEMLVSMSLASGENLTVLNTPVRFSDGPPPVKRRPPDLGEHTRVVLQEAGFHDAAIDELYGAGVVA